MVIPAPIPRPIDAIGPMDALRASGEVGDAAALERLLNDKRGQHTLLVRGKTFLLERTATVTTSVKLDLNDATIKLAPGVEVGIRVDSKRYTVSGGNRSAAIIGLSLLPAWAGAILSGTNQNVFVGDNLRLRSDRIRVPVAGYQDGQVVRVAGLDAANGRILIDTAFYDSFPIDTIDVFDPVTVEIFNGRLDLKDAIAASAGQNPAQGIQVEMADYVSYRNLRGAGGDHAGAAVGATAMLYHSADCWFEGFLNISGVPGGGRVGYGLSGSGDEVIFERCGGARNKHAISTSHRLWRTRKVTYLDCYGTTPKDGANEVVNIGGLPQPLYQAILDVHGNVEQAIIERPRLDGVNTLIAIRNGQAVIDKPQLRSRGMGTTWPANVINVYEEPARSVEVRSATFEADPVNLATHRLPYFIGTDYFALAHKTIRVDSLEIGVGTTDVGLFQMVGSNDNQLAASIELVEYRSVRGTFKDGVKIGNGGRVTGFGQIKVHFDEAVLAGQDGITQAGVEVTNALRGGHIKLSGTLDARTIHATGTAVQQRQVIRMGDGGGANVLPSYDVSGLDCRCGGTFLLIGSTSNTAAIPPSRTDGAKITYNTQGSTESRCAILSYLSTSPAAETTHRGTTLINAGPGSAAQEAIRCSGAGADRHNIDGLLVGGQPYAAEVMIPNLKVPFGFRRLDGALPRYARVANPAAPNDAAQVVHVNVDAQGVLRATAKPYDTFNPGTGVEVCNMNAASGAAPRWVRTAAGWRDMAVLAAA